MITITVDARIDTGTTERTASYTRQLYEYDVSYNGVNIIIMINLKQNVISFHYLIIYLDKTGVENRIAFAHKSKA